MRAFHLSKLLLCAAMMTVLAVTPTPNLPLSELFQVAIQSFKDDFCPGCQEVCADPDIPNPAQGTHMQSVFELVKGRDPNHLMICS